MKITCNNLFIFSIAVFVLACLPVLLAWDIIQSDLLVGKFIDFNVPENKNSAYRLAQYGTSAWQGSLNGGYANFFAGTTILQNFILYGPIYFFESTWALGRWSLLLPLSISGISYFVFFTYFGEIYYKRVVPLINKNLALEAFLLSIIFTYTNFNFNEIHYGSSNYVLSCALLPLALALFHMGALEAKIGPVTLVSLLVTCVAGGVLQNLIILSVFFVFLSFFSGLRLFYLCKYFALYILLSLYWIFPLVMGISDISKAKFFINYIPGIYSIYDLLANRIYTAINGRVHYELGLTPFFGWLYAVASGLFLLTPIYLILRREELSKKNMFREFGVLAVILITTLFFLKGVGPPFGQVNRFLYENVSALALFRTSNRFWPFYYLALAFMYAYVIHMCRWGAAYAILLALAICSPWYLVRDLGISEMSLNNPHLPHVNLYPSSSENDIFQKILDQPGEFRILTKPMSYSVRFMDALGTPVSQGGDADLFFGKKGFFSTDSSSSDEELLTLLEYKMYTDDNFLIDNASLLKLLGVKYFIVRKNVTTEFSRNRLFANGHSNYAEHFGVVSKVFSDSRSDVFQFAEYLPEVSTVNNRNELDDFFKVADLYQTQGYDRFRWPAPNLLSKWDAGEVNFKKYSDSIYQVSIVTVSDSLPIFLNQNFSEDWILIPNPHYFFFDSLSQIFALHLDSYIQHYRGPLSNNGWILNVRGLCLKIVKCEVSADSRHTFDGFIIYRSQLYFIAGFVISVLVLFCFIFVLAGRKLLWLREGLNKSST